MSVSTTAPLPQLGDFAAVLARRAADDRALAAPWTGPGDTPFLLARAAWALRVLAEARAAELGDRPLVWLPDYFCNEATEPVRAVARLRFYPVGQDLAPDWPGCETLARAGRPHLFLLVHYFGRPADAATARAFCDVHRARLVEDAAHVLAPAGTVGMSGDATLWSLYKHLPLPDGGLLTLRRGGEFDAARVAAAVQTLDRRAPPVAGWIARRALQRIAPGLAGRLRAPPVPFDRDPPPAPPASAAAPSSLTRRLLAGYAGALPTIAARRRANERALRRALAATELRPLLPACDGTWTPFRAVFRAPDEARARSWYDRFTAAGNAVESWPDLPPELHADPERHEAALALRATVLALPIHADRTPEELAAAYGAG